MCCDVVNGPVVCRSKTDRQWIGREIQQTAKADVISVRDNIPPGEDGELLRALTNYTNSFASYSFSRGSLVGLGADINQNVLNTIGQVHIRE